MKQFDLEKVEWTEMDLPAMQTAKHHIYFLYDKDDRIVYIGQARNVLSRFASHLSEKAEAGISRARYFLVDGDQDVANEIEAELIIRFNPPYNITVPPNRKYMSIDTFQSKNPALKGKGVRIRKAFQKFKCVPVGRGFYYIKDLEKMLSIVTEGGSV
jgi:hypothetical protein